MRIADWRRRRVGGAAAVVAAFWLGFLCGGGGSASGAAAIGAPAEARQQDPPPAPEAPAGQPQDPSPAPQAGQPQDPPPAPEEAPEGQPPVTEESPEADPAPGAPTGPQAEGDPAADVPPGPEAEGDPAADAPPGPEPPLVQDRPREFTASTGVVLYFVTAGGESAFEESLARVAEALTASDSEERQQQAEGWRTYRAEEPLADGVVLYVSWLDPAVPGADYWIPGILNEAFPTEAQSLYEAYAGAFADGQILLNLTPVAGP